MLCSLTWACVFLYGWLHPSIWDRLALLASPACNSHAVPTVSAVVLHRGLLHGSFFIVEKVGDYNVHVRVAQPSWAYADGYRQNSEKIRRTATTGSHRGLGSLSFGTAEDDLMFVYDFVWTVLLGMNALPSLRRRCR